MRAIRPQRHQRDNLVQEIRAHWLLESCEGLLSLLEIYEEEAFVQLVLEYQEGGTLHDHIKNVGKFKED
jgi:serine/threonine protein kinase